MLNHKSWSKVFQTKSFTIESKDEVDELLQMTIMKDEFNKVCFELLDTIENE